MSRMFDVLTAPGPIDADQAEVVMAGWKEETGRDCVLLPMGITFVTTLYRTKGDDA